MRLLFMMVPVLAFAFSPVVARAQSQTVPFPVALSGTAAPAGGNYTGFVYAPVLNDSGQVAFVANTSVSGAGVFAGTPGSPLTTAALQGTPAPAGGNYTSFSYAPVLNASGQVAFRAQTSVAGQGIFAGTPGSTLTTVALTGTASPTGENFRGFGTPVLNNSGHVAFYGFISGFITGGPSSEGLFASTPGMPLTTIALYGTPAPSGGNYSYFGYPVLNASGTVAFIANLIGLPSPGLFAGTPGLPMTTVALTGTAAPSGGNYNGFPYSPVINASGQVAFYANLALGTSFSGIFAGTPGSTLSTVALDKTVAPAGGNFTGFNSPPVINSTGQVAFSAITSISGNGIFVGTTSSTLATAALQGTFAPNCGGATFNGTFNYPVINGSGQVAFIGTLTGTGVVSGNNQGLFAGVPGSIVLVVRTGDVIDVDLTAGVDNRTVSGIVFPDTANSTVSGGQDGLGMSFNDSGELVYELTFTDGSSGIFTSQIPVTAVPEPTTLAMIGMGLGVAGFVWYLRRQRLGVRGIRS